MASIEITAKPAFRHIAEAAKTNMNSLESSEFDHQFKTGVEMLRSGRVKDAVIAMERAIAARPDHAQARHNLGIALKRQGDLGGALRSFAEALRINPHLTASRLTLADVLKSQGRSVEAIQHVRIALSAEPTNAAGWRTLGFLLKGQGDSEESVAAFEQAAALNPQDAASKIGAVMALLPPLFDNREDIARSRKAYATALEALPTSLQLDTHDGVAAAADALGSFLPYYLAYHGESDRTLQDQYGRMAADLLARRHPEFAAPPVVEPEHVIRVAVVSGFFCWHTIWKLFIRGWMEGFDRQRFQLFGYHTSSKTDRTTATARNGFDHFVEGETSFVALARRIRSDRPHVVLFPEIGMDNLTARLAAIRLAPFQCVAWGHPDTTGLPTIDAFLSSDLMEPPGAEEDYTERLVRLPGIGIHYPQLSVPIEPLDLASFGIGPDDILYLCCQYLSKYLPGDDDLIARIARAVPRARFLFINPRKDDLANRLRTRMRNAFERLGVADAEHRLVFLPYLSPGCYASLNAQAHVYLDSVGWSGGNTTLEAVAHGLPVVTWPRGLMRGRHSAAILASLGVRDTVAVSADMYVDIAVRLGQEPAFRMAVRKASLDGLPKLYSDTRPIRALEKLLQDQVWTDDAVLE